MNAQSTSFDYDDFEQYLLDAARIDQAPSDLPARLGVALGLGVPILVASEMASVVPTTTSLSAGTGAAKFAAGSASKGLFAAVKSSLDVGSSTMWSTAAKGIAVGVLSGAAVVGVVQSVMSLVDGGKSSASSTANNSVVPRQVNGSNAQSDGRAARLVQPAAAQGDSQYGLPPPNEGSDTDESEVGGVGDKQNLAYVGGFGTPMGLTETEADKPVRRLPRPIFPEKTTAIARYPLIFDDVSALYDTPKKPAASAAPPPAAPAEVAPLIDPLELAELRTKAITQSRTLLGQGKAAQALLEMNKFRKRVGDRNFGVDELLVRIEALATLGRAKEAQADVAVVERLAPNSAALRQAQQLAASRFVR